MTQTKNVRDVESAISFRRFHGSEAIKSHTGDYTLSVTDREFKTAGIAHYLYVITNKDGGLILIDSGQGSLDKREDLIRYMNEVIDVKKFWEK